MHITVLLIFTFLCLITSNFEFFMYIFFSVLSKIKVVSVSKNLLPSIRKMTSTTTATASTVRYLNQEEAISVDQDLFNAHRFSVDQLMELAGLSVAVGVAKYYPHKKGSRILIITGPGNNGGDGLVASRHLKLFGFNDVHVLNTRKPTKELYINLLHQAAESNVEISSDPGIYQNDSSIGLIIDALFGFSFKPPVREDFVPFMSLLANSKSPVVSVDIPSGWNVESGPSQEDNSTTFMPDMLISLTAPKLCAKYFTGTHHILGGRFVPEKLAQKYALNLPEYPGTDCIVKL